MIDHDYVSPNLDYVDLGHAFPNMIVGDKSSSIWPYLRKNVGHNWYVDKRNPSVGFLNADEASILHGFAKLMVGKPCLEIGCWRGWSTAHIAVGSGNLETIDPILQDKIFHDDVAGSLDRAGVLDRIILHPLSSPRAVDDLSRNSGKRWGFVFIDGDHEGDAPLNDAKVVQEHAADTAVILFHDLVSPYVANGLEYLAGEGWNTAIYQTMQIMGVAWRGDINPIAHLPDPAVEWDMPEHLKKYRIVDSALSISASSSGDRRKVTLTSDAELARKYPDLLNELEKMRMEMRRTEQDLAELHGSLSDLQLRYDNIARLVREVEEDRDRAVQALHAHYDLKTPQIVTIVDDSTDNARLAFVEWATTTSVLLRLLRKRTTQPSLRARELVIRQCLSFGFKQSEAEAAAQWLRKSSTLWRLLRNNLSGRRDRSIDLVQFTAAEKFLGKPLIDESVQINPKELGRLKAIEQAKLIDEKLISDLYVELAILRKRNATA